MLETDQRYSVFEEKENEITWSRREKRRGVSSERGRGMEKGEKSDKER
jgi:hypothetical protein